VKNASLSQIKVISFDLDDTLWDCAPAIEAAEQALFAWHQQVTPAIVQAHDLVSLQVFRTTIRAEFPELQGCVTASRLAGLRRLLAEFGYPEALAEEGFTVFYRARSDVQLYYGALELLSALKQDYRLAAITNGNADLQSIGIAEFFDFIYAADLTMPAKPAPEMFQRCLTDMNVPAKALLHIGDNPVTDIFGGHNAGVQTLWFNQYNETWPDHLEVPHHQAQSLTDISALFQEQTG